MSYIERGAAIDAVQQAIIEEYDRNYGVIDSDIVYGVLEEVSSADVVPVVFCKDCWFFTADKSAERYCCRPEGLVKAKEDDFCSYGERER